MHLSLQQFSIRAPMQCIHWIIFGFQHLPGLSVDADNVGYRHNYECLPAGLDVSHPSLILSCRDPSTRKCDSIEYIGKEQDCFENSSVPLGIFADECGKKHSSQGSCVQDDTCLWCVVVEVVTILSTLSSHAENVTSHIIVKNMRNLYLAQQFTYSWTQVYPCYTCEDGGLQKESHHWFPNLNMIVYRDTKADSCRIDVEKTILGFSTAGEMANQVGDLHIQDFKVLKKHPKNIVMSWSYACKCLHCFPSLVYGKILDPKLLCVLQVKSSRRAALDAEFNSNLVSFISSPDAILTWEFKELSCPVEASDTLCEYVATLDLAFIQNKYCSAKFDITEISSCNMDPLCNIGRTAACELSEKARAAVDEGAVQVCNSNFLLYLYEPILAYCACPRAEGYLAFLMSNVVGGWILVIYGRD